MAQMKPLPASFEKNMSNLLGDDYTAFKEALFEEPAVSFRLNIRKWTQRPSYVAVPWATDGYYLTERPSFTFDPLFHAGCYYVQEASSMFVEQAVKQHLHEAHVALDLCAAPGGKSTLLRSLLPDDCVLVSNEVMRNRAQVLVENVQKWGHPRCVVTSNMPDDFGRLTHLFDIILVDAPCSGEGMFRKDDVAIAEWSDANVEVCWKRQRDILTAVWPSLRPGGLLVYSTCTFNTKEDEENVRWMMDELGAELLPVAVDEAWKITPSFCADVPHVYHFLPGRTQGEGFFLAVLRKPEGEVELPRMKRRDKNAKKVAVPEGCQQWLADDVRFTYKLAGNEVMALPTDMEETYTLLSGMLHILSAGVTVGELKGKEVIPSQALALSTALRDDAFPRVPIDYKQALQYLHKEAITLPPDTPRGFVLVTYRDVPIGFMKNIGNRANNLYPNEWRIRSGYHPEDEQGVL